MSADLESSGGARGLKNVSFHSNPKERQCQRYSDYCITALISPASKVMLKIFQARLRQYLNCELLMFKLDLEKAEEPEIKLPTSIGSSKKQENPRKTSTSVLLTTLKPLTVWITTNWKIPKEMGIPYHLICLLRNLYADQETTVRTGHGRTDCFQMGKEVHQGCILSPCLFSICRLHHEKHWTGESTSWNQVCWETYQ